MPKEKFVQIGNIYKLFTSLEGKRVHVVKEDKEIIVHSDNFDELDKLDETANFIVERAPSLKKTIKKVLIMMVDYDFINTPSVDRSFNIIAGKDNMDSYDLLFNYMNLYNHTHNVACEIINLGGKGNGISINILNALFHDFGKSMAVKEQYPSLNNLSHEKISALFAEEFLLKEIALGNKEITRGLAQKIKETINIQHSPVKKGSYLLESLIEADSIARSNELTFIKNHLRGIYDS